MLLLCAFLLLQKADFSNGLSKLLSWPNNDVGHNPVLVDSGFYNPDYKRDPPVTETPPGFWMAWTAWSQCTRTCGGGTFMRMRMCMPMGSDCTGRLVEMRGCNENVCPNSAWTGWTEWGGCAVEDGTCRRSRSRGCLPFNEACQGDKEEKQSCDQDVCLNTGLSARGEWSEWSLCSVTCKSTRTRSCSGSDCESPIEIDFVYCSDFLCDKPVADWGPWTTSFDCECTQGAKSGWRTKTRQCPLTYVCEGRAVLKNPCPCSGTHSSVWQQWESWSHCSCQDQLRTRVRQCPEEGDCYGSRTEKQSCVCLESPPTNQFWTTWAQWSQCPDTCGPGTKQRRRRDCVAENKQLYCDSRDAEIETRSCPCSELKLTDPNAFNSPVNWLPWAGWSDCNCNTNKRYRRRICGDPRPPIPLIEPECPGDSEESDVCESNTDKECEPTAGGWSAWTAYSGCPNNCGCGRAIRSYRRRACSTPVPVNGGKECFGAVIEYQPCNSKPCPHVNVINGKATEWSAWTGCTHSCTAGKELRFRSCTNPSPHNGGTYCGNLVEEKPCTGQLPNCDLVIGSWAKWTSWSPCSASCGSAVRTSVRTCSQPTPSNDIYKCPGRVKWYKPCYDLPECNEF